MSVKSIKSTLPVAIVTVFHLFVTDEAGGISARNVLQIYERCDWCAGIFWKKKKAPSNHVSHYESRVILTFWTLFVLRIKVWHLEAIFGQNLYKNKNGHTDDFFFFNYLSILGVFFWRRLFLHSIMSAICQVCFAANHCEKPFWKIVCHCRDMLIFLTLGVVFLHATSLSF